MRPYLLLLALVSVLGFARAETPSNDTPEPEVEESTKTLTPEQQRIVGIVKSLHYQEGSIDLPGGMATLNLPPGYRYLNGADAKKVLVDLWRNPPDAENHLLGMIVPAGTEVYQKDGWAIVADFEDQGYVSDKDADSIDYSELLDKMKEADKEDNVKRKAGGFETFNLVGWALPPHYDKERRVLYWAKQYSGEHGDDTLNYDVRVLGRRGVLSLVAVAGMDQLNKVQSLTPEIVSMVTFKEGHRYADFNPKTDTVAKVGLAGLVAGGAFVAAKAGLFKGIWVALLAAKKFVVMGCVAIAGFFKKMFGKKQEG